jgi:hypothetical protein
MLQKLDLFLIMGRVWLVCLFLVTVDDGIDVHVNASYFQAQGVQQLQLVSKVGFHTYHCRKSTSQMYEDEKGSSTFKVSVCWTDSQNCVNFLRLKFSFNDVSSDRSMSSSSAFVDIPVVMSPWNGFGVQSELFFNAFKCSEISVIMPSARFSC